MRKYSELQTLWWLHDEAQKFGFIILDEQTILRPEAANEAILSTVKTAIADFNNTTAHPDSNCGRGIYNPYRTFQIMCWFQDHAQHFGLEPLHREMEEAFVAARVTVNARAEEAMQTIESFKHQNST